MKFKTGDKVKIIGHEERAYNGKVGIITDIDEGYEPHPYSVMFANGLVEIFHQSELELQPTYEIGRTYLMGDNEVELDEHVLAGHLPHHEYPFWVQHSLKDDSLVGYKICKEIKKPETKELTLQEIADKFNVPVNQLRIKE